MDRLRGRVCVVAGARGVLGEAVARRFRDEGGLVVGVDKGEHAVGQLALTADLSDEAQVSSLYEQVWDTFQRLDVIYNNAGLVDQADHSALDLSIEVWNRVLAANLTTTWLSCKHDIPYMLRSRPVTGSVINTASFLAGMGRHPPRWRSTSPRPGWSSCHAISASTSRVGGSA